jgi:hypothetical protein
MALCMLDNSELDNYRRAFAFLQENYDSKLYKHLYLSIFRIPFSYTHLFAQLFKLSDEKYGAPCHTFVLF